MANLHVELQASSVSARWCCTVKPGSVDMQHLVIVGMARATLVCTTDRCLGRVPSPCFGRNNVEMSPSCWVAFDRTLIALPQSTVSCHGVAPPSNEIYELLETWTPNNSSSVGFVMLHWSLHNRLCKGTSTNINQSQALFLSLSLSFFCLFLAHHFQKPDFFSQAFILPSKIL